MSLVREGGARNTGGFEVYDPGSDTSGEPIKGPEDVGWAPDGARLIGVSGGEIVTFDRSGQDVAIVAAVVASQPAWQRVAE